MDMDKILEFLQQNKIFYFATVDGDKPRVRPLGMFMEFENKLYLSVATHKPSYAQLKANPNVEICTAGGEGSWIRIKGKAVFDDRAAVIERIFERMPMLKDMYSKESGLKLAPFYLADGEAIIADFKGNVEKIIF